MIVTVKESPLVVTRWALGQNNSEDSVLSLITRFVDVLDLRDDNIELHEYISFVKQTAALHVDKDVIPQL